MLLPRFVDISKKALSPTGGKRRGEPRRCGRPQSHLKNANRPASMLPSSARQRVLKNSSRSAAPFVLFFDRVRQGQASEHAAYASLAHRDPARGEKELGPLGVGGPRALSEVF